MKPYQHHDPVQGAGKAKPRTKTENPMQSNKVPWRRSNGPGPCCLNGHGKTVDDHGNIIPAKNKPLKVR